MNSRPQQRRAARAARQALTPRARRHHARAIARTVLQWRFLKPRQRIAVYWPFGSELDSRELIAALLTRGCRVFLPRIESRRACRMRFVEFDGSPLRRNVMGIAEPGARRKSCAPCWLDIVLLPLVGFDARGNRLGNGAGYYDRALGFRRRRRFWRGPRLVGLAFAAQRLDAIDAEPHDVRLDGIVTEQGYREFRP